MKTQITHLTITITINTLLLILLRVNRMHNTDKEQ